MKKDKKQYKYFIYTQFRTILRSKMKGIGVSMITSLNSSKEALSSKHFILDAKNSSIKTNLLKNVILRTQLFSDIREKIYEIYFHFNKDIK